MAQKLARFSDGRVYLDLFGEYWYITDPATLTGVFGPKAELGDATQLKPLGPEISAGSFLWSDGDAIYFMCTSNNTIYRIADSAALNHFQFNGTSYACDSLFRAWIRAGAQTGREIRVS